MGTLLELACILVKALRVCSEAITYLSNHMDLNAHYRRWEKFAQNVDEDGSAPAPPAAFKPQDVKFSLGKPLTEEEFAEHRRKHKNTQLVK